MANTVIAGRTVLITGGARGIGEAVARRLHAEGMRVVLVDIDEAAVVATASQISEPGRPVHGFALDVTDAEAFLKLVESVEQNIAPVDVLINNAGLMSLGPFLQQPISCDQAQIAVNLSGVIHGMRACLPFMVKRKRGHVVNMASSAGKISIPYAATYSATKSAVIGLSEAVRHEVRSSGVSVSYVMPSLVKTELIAGAGRLRYPPLVTVEQVADAVVVCLRSKKVGVFVPRFAGFAAALPVFLPRRVVEKLGRWFGLESMFRDVDRSRRQGYRTRSNVL